MRERFQKLLPAQFQQAGHHQPHFEEGASPFVFVDVDHAAVDVHAASLGGERGTGVTGKEKQGWAVPSKLPQPLIQRCSHQGITAGRAVSS